ncbi:MAG: hypothetical protein AAGC55_22830 [Myxococcota bacterium]
MRNNALLIVALFGLLSGSTGCLLAGNYHSAKTLAKGESSFGMNFSATTYSVDGGAITLPNVIPEITYHVGLTDNLEIGGRVGIGSLAMEGDNKYRFLRSPNLHMAIAPSIGAQTLILISGTSLKLPVIATYELADNVAVTGSLFGISTRYSNATGDDSDDDLAVFGGSLVGTGASIGLEFSGSVFAIRPAVEFTNYSISIDDADDSFEAFNTVNFMVHIAFIGGREKQQLDRIENMLLQGGQQQPY